MLLYIIRHGDPTYDPDALTPLGHRQAEALGKRLSLAKIDEVYSSPMNRAQQTAQPLCEMLHKKPTILEWTSEALAWDEFTFHDPRFNGGLNWTFHAQTDSYKTPGIIAMGDKWYEAEPFCQSKAKQGWERIGRESDAFLESLGYKRNGLYYEIISPNEKRVAVFCHQGFGTTWLAHLLCVPPVIFWSTFDITHSSVTIIRFQNNKNGRCAPMCVALSDTSHIYAERLPMKFCNEFDI